MIDRNIFTGPGEACAWRCNMVEGSNTEERTPLLILTMNGANQLGNWQHEKIYATGSCTLYEVTGCTQVDIRSLLYPCFTFVATGSQSHRSQFRVRTRPSERQLFPSLLPYHCRRVRQIGVVILAFEVRPL